MDRPHHVRGAWLAAVLLGLTAAPAPSQGDPEAPASDAGREAPQEEAQPETGSDQEAVDRALQQEITRLERTYVITATRHQELLFDIPYAGTVEAGPVLDRSRTIQDTLRETPGVQLQRTSYGQTSPYLRGLTGFHTLMMIDGIRLNNSVLRSGPNEYWGLVDALSLDRVEVVLGPGSVLHGSDAVGGSVNAITLRRREYGPESSWDRRAYFRFSSAENSLTGRAQVSGNVGEVFGFVLGGTVQSFDDLEAGGAVGDQPHTGYHTGFGDVSLDFNLDDHWTLRVLGQLARVVDVSRSHRTRFGVGFQGTTIGSDRRRDFDWDRELAAAFLEGYELDGPFDEVLVRLSWQRIEEVRERVRSDGRLEFRGFDVNTLGVGVQLTTETVIGRLTYGLDWYHDTVDSFRDNFDAMGNFTGSEIQGPVGDDAAYDLFGVYVQDQVRLLENLDLVAGGRFQFAAADADSVEDPDTGAEISVEDDWVSAVGSVRLNYAPVDEVRLFAGASQAFRAPNLSDLTRLDTARTNEIEVPSPGLDPEDFLSLEAGMKVRWCGVSLQAAFYHTLIDDLIIRQPTGMMIGGDVVVEKRNGGDGHVQGVDVQAAWDIDECWRVFATFQWVDGQAETFPTSAPVSETEAISRLTPVNGTVGVRWQTADGKVWVRGWVRIVDGQDRLNTRDRADTSRIPPGGTPGYTTYNIEAGYALDPQKRIFIALENLTDKNYRIHGSGLQEPGFNAIVGADVTF